MSMISFFTCQIRHLRRNDFGQAAVLFITTITAILALVFAVVYTSHLGSEKVASSNAVDSIALSAATWEARGLNLIAALNDGILQCIRAIRLICTVWASLAVAAVLGAGMPAFIAYSQRAPGMIRSYWNTAKELEKWAGKIKAITPSIVLSETASLSRKLKVTGALIPFNPKGPHDGDNTLELHLKPGAPIRLVDAMAPITAVPGRIGKWKLASRIIRAVTGIIDPAIRSILGAEGAPIRMLEPEDDFTSRQKVRFTGFKTVSPLPIPYLAMSDKHRFPSDSFAEPYGGGTALMSWKSRITEKPGK